jgi:hypothetical protein
VHVTHLDLGLGHLLGKVRVGELEDIGQKLGKRFAANVQPVFMGAGHALYRDCFLGLRKGKKS